jgi:hypothetical protein
MRLIENQNSGGVLSPIIMQTTGKTQPDALPSDYVSNLDRKLPLHNPSFGDYFPFFDHLQASLPVG